MGLLTYERPVTTVRDTCSLPKLCGYLSLPRDREEENLPPKNVPHPERLQEMACQSWREKGERKFSVMSSASAVSTIVGGCLLRPPRNFHV